MVAMLRGLGCTVENQDGTLVAAPPSWRGDLDEEHDLVEEVARLYGYDNIDAVPLPRLPMPKPVLTPRQKTVRLVTRGMAARGLLETVTWSFLPRAQAALFGGGSDAMQLANPISSDLDALRPSALPNLITAAGRNAARGFADLGLFEIGPQFSGGEPGDQKRVVAGIRAGKTGPRHWAGAPRVVDALDAKADALAALTIAGVNVDNLQVNAEAPAWYHPGRSGSLRLGPTVLAVFGELHPGVLKALDVKGTVVGFEVFIDDTPLPKAKATKARPLLNASMFQPVERDFAFVVETSIQADALVRAAKSADKALIAEVGVFDLYEGANMPEGKKSLAITVTLQPRDRTLTEDDIDLVSNKVISNIEKATGGTLRG
jgi:phenylalanyl-tRNA synthetase beta chain